MQASTKTQELAPDAAVMCQHLQAWAKPILAEYPEGLLEIRAIDPDGARPVRARMFGIDDDGLSDAVAYAVRQNTVGQNVYLGLNPRKPGTDLNSAASANDVEVACWAAIDCDTKQASAALCEFIDDAEQPSPSFLVLTGTAPHARLHAYWALDGAIRNHTSREAVMRGLAARFGGDAIHDGPRVLRLAGSVSYPSERKMERGYREELVQLTIDPSDEAVPVSVEELLAAFPAPSTEPKATKPAPANGNGGDIPALAKLSDAELSELFANLPNDADRDEWVRIGLAVKADLGDAGFDLFDRWSQRHPSYDEHATRRFFETARPTGSISGASIVHMAQQAGCLPRRERAAPRPSDSHSEGYPLTEDGLALAFKDRFRDALRFDHSIAAWFEWSGTHWRRDETRRAFNFARETVRELSGASNDPAKAARPVAKAATASAVERFAQADPDLAVSGEAWDADPMLLGTPGGTVDLRTGELRRAVPWENVTKITGVAPSEKADCPHWLRFLDETTGGDGELVAYLQRVVGYSLTGLTSEHALFFVYGPGGNGKSVFLDAITNAFGDYGRSAPIDTFTASKNDRHPTELAGLKGARLVSASETEEGRRWDEAKVKLITGGDRIAARFMRGDFFEFTPEFKLLIVGNFQPNLRNVDDAMRRRIHMIPFVRKPKVIDPDLPAKLKAEAAGILRWAIDGCLAWQAKGLARPAVVEAATADYFAAQDVFGDWLDTNCRVEPENTYLWTSSAELYEDWKNFAVSAGEEPGKQTGIAARLAKRGIRPHRKKSGRGFSGIALETNPYSEAAKDDATPSKRAKF